MRWILLVIGIWVLVIVQTTMGQILTFETRWLGAIGPDLLASLAVFVALYAQNAADTMIAAFLLGFALDATAFGGSGGMAVIGPMAIAYGLAARALFAVREAFFRQRVLARIVLTLLFCLFAHGLWVTSQAILAGSAEAWSNYGRMLLQASAISVYSAALAPGMFWVFDRLRRRIMSEPTGRSRYARR
jgi:uncharacterized membrane protein